MNRVYELNDEDFREMIANSTSYLQVVLKLGYTKNGRYPYDLVKKRCKELNISTNHFKVSNNNKARYSLDEILVENSSYTNLTCLKKRIIDENLIEYKCDICGNRGEWNGQKLSLQLDHVNGIHTDNRLCNLRLLCPNCHSQTETFSKKNRSN